MIAQKEMPLCPAHSGQWGVVLDRFGRCIGRLKPKEVEEVVVLLCTVNGASLWTVLAVHRLAGTTDGTTSAATGWCAATAGRWVRHQVVGAASAMASPPPRTNNGSATRRGTAGVVAVAVVGVAGCTRSCEHTRSRCGWLTGQTQSRATQQRRPIKPKTAGFQRRPPWIASLLRYLLQQPAVVR